MNLTDTEILKFQMGAPIFLEDICAIYPATLKEIILEGYDNFQQYLSIMMTEKPTSEPGQDSELNQLLTQITDFQYLLMMATLNVEINSLLKRAFKFFIHEEVMVALDPPQIVVGMLDEQRIMNEEKYTELRKILRRMYFLDDGEEEIVINDDDDMYTRKIKMDLRRAREKRRKAKAAQAAREKSDLKFSDLIGSLTINDCGLNILNVYDVTYYAFHDQLKRMGWRDQFNINQKAALAGAKIEKNQLKHWIRSIVADKS